MVADGIVGAKTWSLLGVDTQATTSTFSIIKKPLSVHVTKKVGREIKYLAIHFTGSSNSRKGRAQSAYNTFTTRSASADFCVDDAEIVQFNPDIKNYYCWAVGDKKYNNKGGSLYGKAVNSNTISIEVCSTCNPSTSLGVSHANHSGWSFTPSVVDNAVKLARYLMKTYNIPLERVIRHYDISGKLCPGIIGWNNELVCDINGKSTGKYSDSSEWEKFKERLK